MQTEENKATEEALNETKETTEVNSKVEDDFSIIDIEANPNRVYELSYLVIPTVSEEAIAGIYGDLKRKITSLDGEIISDDMPKMIPLAYTMLKVHKNIHSKFDTAYFGWIKFIANPEKILELKKILDQDGNILRFMIIKTIKENTIASRRFTHREGGGSSYRKSSSYKKTSDEAPVEINEKEIDKEIEALVE